MNTMKKSEYEFEPQSAKKWIERYETCEFTGRKNAVVKSCFTYINGEEVCLFWVSPEIFPLESCRDYVLKEVANEVGGRVAGAVVVSEIWSDNDKKL